MSDESKKPNIHIGGDVNGGNIVIGGKQTVHGDLTISMGEMPAASADVRETLQTQIKDLLAELEKQSAEHTRQVKEIKMATADAVTEAEKSEPDKESLQIRGENLVKAAKNLLAVAPIAVKIAETLLRIGG